MNVYRLFAILNTLSLIGVLIVNYLANALPINGKTTGELSDAYPNVFVPAGLTFSIWGVIYIFLIIFVIFQFTGGKIRNVKEHHFLSRISFFFVLNCIANITWIILWHHEMIFLSLLVMLIIFMTLYYIYTRLEIGKRQVPTMKKWAVHIPFSIYLGWITVATIANVTTVLVDINWGGLGLPEAIWAMIMIFIATFVGFKVFSDRKDYAYVLVLIWAFLGIFIKRSSIGGNTDTVALAAGIGMVMLAVTLILGLFRKQKANE
jgi:hypothetical protein